MFNPSQGMGIGPVGIGDPNAIMKRKFRWTLEIEHEGCGINTEAFYVKVASRPSITIEETEVNFLNDKMFIPGKATWEPINITFLDTNKFGSADILKLLTTVFDFSKPTSKKMSSKLKGYAAKVRLKMYDGCGGVMETWTLGGAWPQTINFGELDYSSSEIADIQMTLRYSQVTYEAGCGANFSPCSCEGC